MRAIFFGSPEFAVPSLAALLEIAEVPLVVTQPDRRAGRGMRLRPPPVKQFALDHGISVSQPTRLRDEAFLDALRQASADVAVVAAYGRILPPAVLTLPPKGCVNVHASLLPRWRGASPIHRAIVAGDRRSGVCLMQMDEGLDTGPVLACRATPIGPDETAGELSERLATLGATLLRERLADFVEGRLQPRPQPTEGATLAPRLRREDGRIDWHAPARAVHDHIRGTNPWPGAWCEVGGRRLKLHRSSLQEPDAHLGPPGRIVQVLRDGPVVACGKGAVLLRELQWEGRKRLQGAAFVAGSGWRPGIDLLTTPPQASDEAHREDTP